MDDDLVKVTFVPEGQTTRSRSYDGAGSMWWQHAGEVREREKIYFPNSGVISVNHLGSQYFCFFWGGHNICNVLFFAAVTVFHKYDLQGKN